MVYLWQSEDNLWESDLTTMKTQVIRLCFYPLTHLSPVPRVVTFVITVSKIKYHRTYFHNPVNKYLLRSFPYEFLSPLAKILDAYFIKKFFIYCILCAKYSFLLPTGITYL